MNKKMQIEMIKNNIEEIYKRLSDETYKNKTVKEMMNDIERLTNRLLNLCS